MAESQFEDEESHSLLCLENFISPTPPSDDQEWISPASSIVWISHHGQVNSITSTKVDQQGTNGKVSLVNLTSQPGRPTNSSLSNESGLNIIAGHTNQQFLKHTLVEGVTLTGEKYKVLFQRDINSNFQSKCTSDSQKLVGNDGDTCQRMSGSNGFDRSRVTGSTHGGSNESLSRLSDGAASQGQARPQVAAAEGMLMGRVGGAGAVAFHDPGTRSIVTGSVGAGPQSNISGIFRPPQSVSESVRYGAAYSSAAGSPSAVGPFSPLYTLSPYSAFYGQYPYTLERPIGSYSAVLQSMGTQAQTHVPRSPFGTVSGTAGNMSQYPLLTVNQTSPQSSSKGYASVSPGRDREELKFRREQEMDLHRRHSTTGVVKDESGHHFSVPSGYTEPVRGSVSSVLRESPNHKRGEMSPGGQDFYKTQSGREGSMKYRLLRPSDTTGSIREPQHSAFINTDEPLPKRTKLETSEVDRPETVDPKESGPGSLEHCFAPTPLAGGSNGGGGGGGELHYPQHFMKGSIIQLANGDIKRVEELETNDFVHSADISNDLKIDSSTVVHIEENPTQGTAVLGFVVGEHKVQVSTEATLEHPFFVFGQGWSSCQPTWTLQRYGLDCHKLSVGDVCISLTHKEVSQHAAEISEQQKQHKQQLEGSYIFQKSFKLDSNTGETSSTSQRNKPQGHQSQSPGSCAPQGLSYSRSVLGHSSSVVSSPVKAESASFLSSNQIPITTKAQDPTTPPSTS